MITFKIGLYSLFACAVLIGMTACGKATPSPTVAPTAFPKDTPTPVTSTTPAGILQPGDSQRTLTVDGVERNYLLHIPAGINAGGPVPLVFLFHGYSGDAISIQILTGFNDMSDRGRFIVVYPNGIESSWNAGGCCGTAMNEAIDEAAFLRQIIADLNTMVKVDLKRTYATGFSNGGMLSYRLACEMADTFAAVAPVAGALVIDPCQPGQTVSVISFHGLTDEVVPYAGRSAIQGEGLAFPSTEETMAGWAHLDGCSASPTVEETGIYNHTAYSGCKNGSAVELYAIQGTGHMWPSQYVVPVSQLMWDFFAAHPKP